MNLAFYISNQREAILDGYLQLANELPADRWVCVRPNVACDIENFPSTPLEEPSWYGWRKNPLLLLLQVGFVFRIWAFLLRHDVRRVFLYGIPTPWTFLLAALMIFSRARFHLFIHDPSLHEGETLKRRVLNRLYEMLVIKKARSIAVSYQGGIQELVQQGLARPSSIRVIPLPMLDEFREARGDAQDSDVLFFGRLEQYKGLDLLDAALDCLSKRGVTPKVLIVGKGPLLPEVQEICKKHSGVKSIPDYLEIAELAGLVKRTRIVILPYRSATGTHNIQIANHHGVPAIATRVGSLQEYIAHGENGLLTPPGDAVALADAIQVILGGDPSEWYQRCTTRAREFHAPARFAAAIDSMLEEAPAR